MDRPIFFCERASAGRREHTLATALARVQRQAPHSHKEGIADCASTSASLKSRTGRKRLEYCRGAVFDSSSQGVVPQILLKRRSWAARRRQRRLSPCIADGPPPTRVVFIAREQQSAGPSDAVHAGDATAISVTFATPSAVSRNGRGWDWLLDRVFCFKLGERWSR